MPTPFGPLLERMTERRVLVVGDVMVDEYIDGESSRISAEAPVPVLRFGGRRAVLGGAANTAANVASLGGRVTLIGLVGEDAAGTELAEQCGRVGIDFVAIRDGRPTTRKVRAISQQQQLLRIDYEDDRDIDAATRDRLLGFFSEQVAQSDVVVLSDYAKGLLTGDVCRELIRTTHATGRHVIIDPRPHHGSFYRSCDYLTPNWRESLALLDEPDIEMTTEHIHRVGHSIASRFETNVLLTLGPRGIAFVRRGNGDVLLAPAEAREVFDVSGAGDTVVAAFALAHAAEAEDALAVSLANRAAAIVVGKRGTATVSNYELLDTTRPDGRVLSFEELRAFGDERMSRGRAVVSVAGTFDELWRTSPETLIRARTLGDVLVVVLYTDEPTERGMAEIVLGLRAVDYVYLCREHELDACLDALKPHVHVLVPARANDAAVASARGVTCHALESTSA